VSEPDSVLLGREELERAFTALGERLARRGIIGLRGRTGVRQDSQADDSIDPATGSVLCIRQQK